MTERYNFPDWMRNRTRPNEPRAVRFPATDPIPVAEVDTNVPLKADNGKIDYSLLPLQELAAVVRVLDFGAKKYGRDNYKVGEGHSSNRLLAACLRHLAAYQAGEKTDKDTNESHIAHAACCLIFMLYNQYHGKQP